jgi:tetratricopeptide (TPR) repeat protein
MPHARLLLPLVWLLAGDRSSPEDDPAEKSRVGKELMAAGRYAEATFLYRDLVKAVPGNAGLQLNLGMALHLAGQDEEALPQLQAAHRLLPESQPAALFLGLTNLYLGRPADAVPPLEKAVALQPDDVEARSALVEALLSLDRYLDAEKHLEKLSRLSPKDPATWFNLGRTYEQLAQSAFEDVTKRSPESAFALALGAEESVKLDRRDQAFHLYRRALERDPTFRGLHGALARIYRSAGRADWAAIEDEREKSLPRPSCARDVLECAFSTAKHQDVVAAAAKAQTPKAGYWLARAYDALAGQAFARLAALPPSALSHEWTAETLRDKRRYAESADEWRQAMALARDDPRLKIELAVTLRLDHDFADAQHVLEDVMRTQGGAAEPNYLLGDVLLAQQQPDRAAAFLEKAVALEEKNAYAHGALGRAYALLGRTADAIPHLEQGLPADEDGSVHYQLARAYQAAGRTEKAAAAFEAYEELRKARTESETTGEAAITPP